MIRQNKKWKLVKYYHISGRALSSVGLFKNTPRKKPVSSNSHLIKERITFNIDLPFSYSPIVNRFAFYGMKIWGTSCKWTTT